MASSGIGSYDPDLLRQSQANARRQTGGYSITPPEHQARAGAVPNGVGAVRDRVEHRPPRRPELQRNEELGLFGRIFATIAWLIDGIYNLIFSCFSQEAEQTEDEIARGGMIPTILDSWFPVYPRLGKHIHAPYLIEDLNALPEAVSTAIIYAFFEGRPPTGESVEGFVNNFVMKVEDPREIKDQHVIDSLKKLSLEEFNLVKQEFFQGNVPDPLSVEQFVKGHIITKRFGDRRHAGHLIEDLQALPNNILVDIYTLFFQGVPGAPENLQELGVEEFVNGHVIMRPGALARLKTALLLQINN
ncbi:MAG: hypothetical protein KDK69_03930 [Chlamydiia bacterium]|nr:hypothetical protein [Chlamydiia bacterium]